MNLRQGRKNFICPTVENFVWCSKPRLIKTFPSEVRHRFTLSFVRTLQSASIFWKVQPFCRSRPVSEHLPDLPSNPTLYISFVLLLDYTSFLWTCMCYMHMPLFHVAYSIETLRSIIVNIYMCLVIGRSEGHFFLLVYSLDRWGWLRLKLNHMQNMILLTALLLCHEQWTGGLINSWSC